MGGKRRRLLLDRWARLAIRGGGAATIVVIAFLFAFLLAEALPLWSPPEISQPRTLSFPAGLHPLFVDRDGRGFAAVDGQGRFFFFSLEDGSSKEVGRLEALRGRVVGAVHDSGLVVALDSGGRVLGARVRGSGSELRIESEGSWPLEGVPKPGTPSLRVSDAGGWTLLYPKLDGDLGIVSRRIEESFLGEPAEVFRERALPGSSGAAAWTLGAGGRWAFAAGAMLRAWEVPDRGAPVLLDEAGVGGRRATALGMLLGDRALVVGGEDGSVAVWFFLRDGRRQTGWRLVEVRRFEPHGTAVVAVEASPRERSFVTADRSGALVLHHSTTGRTLAAFPGGAPSARTLSYFPKAQGVAAFSPNGTVTWWFVRNPHPEASWKAFFAPVWYEGYPGPAFVWQSTGGTDAFEPKLSLVPLVFGTFKGTLYAMLFAFPLAILGALYTSQFARPGLRAAVKSTVEIMAGLPSVVLGFLGALWLAPALEGRVPGVLLACLVLPASAMLLGILFSEVRWLGPVRRTGTEALLFVPLLLVLGWASIASSPSLERWLFDGNFQGWLLEHAGLRYDQRNCLVVGFAMGFAVIPIVFTIAEDALSNVPARLVSASLALGATRWQTAVRVVVPAASGGIFSAAMVGFGRAVGETMIVLMATGNTPVMEWNPFTGMRTLSANIAVELPEAPVGSTLYRVLFFTALLLFGVTFVVNTVAELVRSRIRKRLASL
ncbi:MAG: phosphate ABC transporter permease [Candidatus Binatia bacterium]|nr:MAG: phosphate ABC transporter permease [Candidatus Binatia bacterium]